MRRLFSPTVLLCALVLGLPLATATAAGADSHAAAQAAAYEANCASCHGAEGKADTPVGKAMKIPSFADMDLATTEPEAICEGVRGRAQHAAMLKKVDEDDLAAACNRVKELAASGS